MPLQPVQILRTSTPNHPPTGLREGELGVEMAAPTRLWVGVPAVLDGSGMKLLADPAAYVLKIGSTMTGPLVLSADPTAALQAATKQYVDAHLITAVNPPLAFSGSVLSIDLSAYAPLASPRFTGNAQAPTPAPTDSTTTIATTAFVANAVSTGISGAVGNKVDRTGDTMTGALKAVAGINAGANVAPTRQISISADQGYLTFNSAAGVEGWIVGKEAANADQFTIYRAPNILCFSMQTDGRAKFTGSTASSSPATGTLTIPNGGLGVGGSIYAGGDVFVGSGQTQGVIRFGNNTGQYLYFNGTQFQLSGGPLQVTDPTPSTSPTTGALTIPNGGLGVGGDINAGGGIYVSGSAGGNFGYSVTNNNAAADASAAYKMFNNSGVEAYLFLSSSTYAAYGGANTFHIFAGANAGIAFCVNGGAVAGRIQADSKLVWGAAGAFKPGGGPWGDTSDARIKTVLGDYEHGLEEVLALEPKRYVYRGNDTPAATSAKRSPYESSPHYRAALDGIEYIGLIAQDAEQVLPEMVTQEVGYIDGEKVADLRRLDTTALIFALVNACKQLAARVEALEQGR